MWVYFVSRRVKRECHYMNSLSYLMQLHKNQYKICPSHHIISIIECIASADKKDSYQVIRK